MTDKVAGPDGSELSEKLGALRWRPEVERFADLMEAQLRANDHKGGWQDCAPHLLLMRMIEETSELLQELEPSRNAAPAFYAAGAMLNAAANELRPYGRFLECKATPERLRRESADVANFAMMLVDRYGGLGA